MEQNDYIEIVKKIIMPLVDELLNSKNNKLYNGIKIKKEFDDALLKKINKLIHFLKRNIVLSSGIDRHKKAACVMCAIVDYSPFRILKKGYNCEELFFANELLAIYTAISLLECYNQGMKIRFPDTTYEKRVLDPYIRTLCTSLYIGKNNRKVKYTLLSYANILFLLETGSLLDNNT